MDFTNDVGTLEALQFLMTREITHMKAFSLALESLGKPTFSIGRIPPTPGIVDQYFNDSTGVGQMGETDERGPWNQGGTWELVEAPAFQRFRSPDTGERNGIDSSSENDKPLARKQSSSAKSHHKSSQHK
jgi:Mn-containing catalase